MKLFNIWLALLIAGIYAAGVKSVFDTTNGTTEALHTSPPTVEGPILLPQSNYNGWVNPEDLTPIPQCIAQQDQSVWLSAMTKCTSKRCTSHFTFICTHHQWLTDLDCLSVTFSADVIKSYLPYCGRSILAKAQLYRWKHEITGQTWLVEVGDAIDVQSLSPASLSEGYVAVEVESHAPACLTRSVSALSKEPFQRVVASCGFTGTTQHTGNADRPWEYSESLQSMIALDSKTVGYDLIPRGIIDRLIHGGIKDGNYFDKACFCRTFKIDFKKEPCSGLGELEFTKERLWINAICGPSYLPANWTESLKTIQFAYIPIADWDWPKCVADMPKQVIEVPDQCAVDACDVDSNGYCKVTRAVDRACFCRGINYDSCGGSCQLFETRIGYIKWLHGLCGAVQDWHGLPDNWRQLAAPTPVEMIPWQWTLKPSVGSKCPSNQWKLGSLALVNSATVFAALLSHRIRAHESNSRWNWLFKGISIASLQLLANFINALIVQYTPGYEEVPIIELTLLWCSMPRPSWMIILLIIVQPSEKIKLSATGSVLFAEIILQLLSFYSMIMTVNYGRKHDFYLGAIGDVERGGAAKAMYVGALMWLMLFILILVQIMRIKRQMKGVIGFATINAPLTRREGNCTVYGTFSGPSHQHQGSQNASVELCEAITIGIFFLWIAQWLFWGGFVGLGVDEFCPPMLGFLTAVWIGFSFAGTVLVFV